ncbi:hypothetical protein BASA50_001988 [Batrachochytrium salamandrivorans]|uniref:Tail specific protease domain-containing protein n=1 Tax=Batrachochytrium salamandrivorans TaxID=1357716 RepID=A0ABQ8FQD1_9FUNG|nr:hypothetical protein BASA60_011315 [Batrachochytrium salamandrivorans]KAH6564302.1 hypothetical protein BASA62_007986 [Batrachochytrium salamandrivorans]KAH6582162.1 hypothetical protein BASA61_008670 [Batrachochytrium salamandrivorans]KAH6600881.1 hypothetical protein BASA50_001988 [Batrachochytrium salamandrivorans]KAH9264738.1 hypothetical protein BASA83_011772 [Batrachochytrium salamandrivorans]
MLVSSIVALLATATVSVSAANYGTFNLLKDDRAAGRLVFLPTTPAEKNLILTNAENILTAWVNYDSKMTNYGSAADPFPIIKNLRKNINKVTDEELQLSLTDAFVKIRDQHTRWFNTAPYRCFYATTGLTYGFIEGNADIAHKPTVVVTDITNLPQLLDLFGKDYAKIQLGDELHTINGLSFVEWFKQNQFKAGDGANDFGGQRTALDYIGTIYGAVSRFPATDSITLQFKSRTHYKRVYSVTVPYVTGHSTACWGLSSNLYQKLTNVTLPGTPPPPTLPQNFGKTHLSGTNAAQRQREAIKALKNPKARLPADLERKEVQEAIFPKKNAAPLVMNPTGVTKLTWTIYKPESKNMGVIKLEDFEPADSVTGEPGSEKAILIIRSLLANELKDTSSVIFELRGNPGGYISLANGMPQLFKPDFEPFGARYLMNNVTHNIFVNGKDPNDVWSKVWGETKPGSRYTNVAPFDEFKDVNTFGQAYVRPLGLFNDGLCFSACDMFSASIQGHGAGTIFGEEGQTGAGGANILDLDPALIALDPTDFKPYPYTKELTWAPTDGKYYNRLSVGIRQSVRNGRYEGQLIEDTGIKTEIVVRARWSDLQPNSTTNTQYDRIADNLARIGQKSGQSKLHFVSEPFTIEKPLGKFPLAVEAAGIDEFTVFQADGKTIAAQQKTTTNKQKLSIPVSAAASGLGNSRITIVGKTAGVQVLKTNRNVRTIPTNDKYMKISTPGFTFSGLSESVGLYQSSVTASGNGWNNLKGKWVIGNGVKYVENVDSSIEAFFTASVGTKINVGLNVALDSEPDFDFLYLSVKSSSGVEDFFLSSGSLDGTKTFNGVSGGNMTVKGTFPFTTKSEKFSVSLKFTSDGGLNFSGATINSFTVSA